MTSREGNEFVSCPHISKLLNPFLDENIVVDGELYNHDLKNDFNKIISLVKKTKPTAKELAESEKIIQYHVFDIIFLDQPNLEYSKRLEKLKELVIKVNSPKIVLVQVDIIKGFDEVEPALQRYIESGYEGSMVRNLKAPYEHKRSRNILKYKLFQDAEYEIIDVIEGDGNRSGMMGSIILKNENGTTFDASARGNQEFFIDLLVNKANYIGSNATLRYQNLTPDGVPRFGVVIAIRNYE
jgi:DNA ligase-1